jgi:hypothetical protein
MKKLDLALLLFITTNSFSQTRPILKLWYNKPSGAYENRLSRGIIYGGMDYHPALLNDNCRRFLLNAIMWAAGIDVPKEE